jgi:oxygen-independent coproporphyrinogen-3 oxidase
MAGIYIHIPYCKQKCHYCNFFSVATARFMPEVIEAICREAELQKPYLQDNPVETIYFGGGTPSLIGNDFLAKIIDALRAYYPIAPNAEITLEANPDDITRQVLDQWKQLGINRLSIGIQSFREDDLRYLNRVHNALTAYECIDLAKAAGFHDLTIDLIYGIPVLTDEAWLENIDAALKFDIPHLSAYALTVEPKTALDLLIRKGKYAPVDEAQAARQFEFLVQRLTARGYQHYEISNFCKPGHFARHNAAYWKGEPYLGLGPSAHSFNGKSRQWNVSGISAYVQAIEAQNFPLELETLSLDQQYNEYVMTGLRTMWGCNANELKGKFGNIYMNLFLSGIQKFILNGLVISNNNTYILTNKGKLMADGIAADLFVVAG